MRPRQAIVSEGSARIRLLARAAHSLRNARGGIQAATQILEEARGGVRGLFSFLGPSSRLALSPNEVMSGPPGRLGVEKTPNSPREDLDDIAPQRADVPGQPRADRSSCAR